MIRLSACVYSMRAMKAVAKPSLKAKFGLADGLEDMSDGRSGNA